MPKTPNETGGNHPGQVSVTDGERAILNAIADLRVHVATTNGRIEALSSLPDRVAKLEAAHSRLKGAVAIVSALVSLAATWVARLFSHNG